jgi:hypothetical protein
MRSTTRENAMPTLEAFDAEFGLERASDQSALARFLPLIGLVLAAGGIFAALLWGSVDRQVLRLLASRAVEGWQQSQKNDEQDSKQQVDGLLGEIETLKTSKNKTASAQQPMSKSISFLEIDRRNFQQRYSIASGHNWYDDRESLFYRIAAEPTGGRAASPQPQDAARPVVQIPAPAKK